jgi:hypothetical protein
LREHIDGAELPSAAIQVLVTSVKEVKS